MQHHNLNRKSEGTAKARNVSMVKCKRISGAPRKNYRFWGSSGIIHHKPGLRDMRPSLKARYAPWLSLLMTAVCNEFIVSVD